MSKLRQKFQQKALHAELLPLLMILFAGAVVIGSTYIVSDAMANPKVPTSSATLPPNSKHPRSVLDLKTTSAYNSKHSSTSALTPGSKHSSTSALTPGSKRSSTSALTPGSKHPSTTTTTRAAKRHHRATAPTAVRPLNRYNPVFSLILFSGLVFLGLLVVAGRAQHIGHLERLVAMKKKRSEELLDHPSTLTFRMDAQTAFKNLLIDLPGMPIELPGIRATNWRLVESNPSRLHLRLQLRYFHCVTGGNSSQLYPRTISCDARVSSNGILTSEVTLVYGSESAMDYGTVENIVQATNTGLLLTLHNQRMMNSMAALDAQIKSNRVSYVQPQRHSTGDLPAPDASELLTAIDAHISVINEAASVSPVHSAVVAVTANSGVTSDAAKAPVFETTDSISVLRPTPASSVIASEAAKVPVFENTNSPPVFTSMHANSVGSEEPLPPQEETVPLENTASNQMPNQFEPTPLDYKFLLSA